MSESSYEADSKLRIVKFDRTPIMSTYLVAYVVGEFDYIEDHSADGILVRVYTPVGKKDQGRFGLHVATKILPYFKEYFGVEYPLPKMDLVAVPDFLCGLFHFYIMIHFINSYPISVSDAMENWGLLTFRETFLLVDDQNTATLRRQMIAAIVGHEIAHQWFGNYVTMVYQ